MLNQIGSEPSTRPAAGSCSPPVLTDGPYAESKEYCLSSASLWHRVLPDGAVRTPAQVLAEECRHVRRPSTQYLALIRRTAAVVD